MFKFRNQLFVPTGPDILPLIGARVGMVAEAGHPKPNVHAHVRNNASVPYLVRLQVSRLFTHE
jgi:hypothetical protein